MKQLPYLQSNETPTAGVIYDPISWKYNSPFCNIDSNSSFPRHTGRTTKTIIELVQDCAKQNKPGLLFVRALNIQSFYINIIAQVQEALDIYPRIPIQIKRYEKQTLWTYCKFQDVVTACDHRAVEDEFPIFIFNYLDPNNNDVNFLLYEYTHKDIITKKVIHLAHLIRKVDPSLPPFRLIYLDNPRTTVLDANTDKDLIKLVHEYKMPEIIFLADTQPVYKTPEQRINQEPYHLYRDIKQLKSFSPFF